MKSNKIPGIILCVLTVIVAIWGVGYLISNSPSEPYRCENENPAEAAKAPPATLEELRFYDGHQVWGHDDKRELLQFAVTHAEGGPPISTQVTIYKWVHLDPETYNACKGWKRFDWKTLDLMFKDSPRVRAVNTPEDAAKETPLSLAALHHYDGKKIAKSINESCLVLIEDPDSEDYRWIRIPPDIYAFVREWRILNWNALAEQMRWK